MAGGAFGNGGKTLGPRAAYFEADRALHVAHTHGRICTEIPKYFRRAYVFSYQEEVVGPHGVCETILGFRNMGGSHRVDDSYAGVDVGELDAATTPAPCLCHRGKAIFDQALLHCRGLTSSGAAGEFDGSAQPMT